MPQYQPRHSTSSGPSGTSALATAPPPPGPEEASVQPEPLATDRQQERRASKFPLIAGGAGLLVFVGVLLAGALYFEGPGQGPTSTVAGAPGARSNGAVSRNGGGGSASAPPRGVRTKAARGAGPAITRGAGHGAARAGTGRGGAVVSSSRRSGASHGAGFQMTPTLASAAAVNLAVPAGFGPVLRSAWVSARPEGVRVSAADVRSTLPGSVFYAAQRSVGSYWAISSFVPSAQARAAAATPTGRALLAQFSKVAVFYRAKGQPWAYLGSSAEGTCPSEVPAPVFTAWGMCSSRALASVGS